MGKKNIKGISTIVLHTANHENDNFSHTTPIYATSTFTFSSADEGMARFKGDDKTRLYTRWGNPTFNVAEKTIEALEARGLTNESGAPLEVKALLHSSGQAAISTLFFSNLSAGDCLISHYSLYGGSQELMQKVLNEAGVKIILIDIHNEALLLETIKANPTTKLIHLETPANPTLQCVDIEAVCKIARAHGIKVSVDNTVATPYLQQPFALGADYVMLGGILNKSLESCSTTKLFGIPLNLTLSYYIWYNHKWMRKHLKKSFRGMSTKEVQKKWGRENLKTSEGIVKTNPVEYTISQWTENFTDYLKSAMSYTNSRTLDEFRESEFVFITQNALNRFNK